MNGYSINSLGVYDGYNAIANDPYFQYYLQQQQAIAANYQQQPQPQQPQQTQTNVPTATANPAFTGATEEIGKGKEKKSNTAKWILGILAVAGTVFAGYKCFKKGNGKELKEIFSATWNGMKQYWNQGIEAISKWKFNTNQSTVAGWHNPGINFIPE